MTTAPVTPLIGIGIVGCNYGRLVHLPAFRLDPRCEVVALAGRAAARTADLAGAQRMVRAAEVSGQTTMVDFNFCEVLSWTKAKALLDQGAIGRLRHVEVNWNVENYSTRMRLKNWKTN